MDILLYFVNMKYLKECDLAEVLDRNVYLKILRNLVLLCMVVFFILLFNTESKFEPNIVVQELTVFQVRTKPIDPSKPFFQKHLEMEEIECDRFFQNDTAYEDKYTNTKLTYKDDEFLSSDCRAIKMRHYFPEEPLSEAEAQFPIAFARIVYKVISFHSQSYNLIYAGLHVSGNGAGSHLCPPKCLLLRHRWEIQ